LAHFGQCFNDGLALGTWLTSVSASMKDWRLAHFGPCLIDCLALGALPTSAHNTIKQQQIKQQQTKQQQTNSSKPTAANQTAAMQSNTSIQVQCMTCKHQKQARARLYRCRACVAFSGFDRIWD
jgi:hypothetical protein